MSVVLGKDVVLYGYKDGSNKVLACGKSCALSIDTEIIDRTTVSSGSWRNKKAKSLSWSITADGLMTYDEDFTIADVVLLQTSKIPLIISFEATDTDGNSVVYSGSVIIENTTQTGADGQAGSFSLSAQGDGAISTTYVPVITTPSTVDTHYYSATGGEYSFELPILINKDAILIFRDGTEYTVASGVPGNREARFEPTFGRVTFEIPLEPGEYVAVTYQ